MSQRDQIAALERQVALLADRLGNAETGLSVMLSIILARHDPASPVGEPRTLGRVQ